MTDEEVIQVLERWSKEVVEKPNTAFGNLPICPFAKRARGDKKIRWEVLRLPLLECTDIIKNLLQDFQPSQHDIMIIIHVNSHPVVHEFFSYLEDFLVEYAMDLGLEILGAHPEDGWAVGEWVTHWPYQCCLVSARSLLKKYSDRLLKTNYYQHWNAEQLRLMGVPRQP